MAASQAGQLGTLGQTAGQLAASQAGQLGTLGQTAGQLTQAQQNALANIGQTQGQLASQQQQNLANIAQNQLTAGQAQQQFGLSAAQAQQNAQAEDFTRQQSALQQLANMAQTSQQLTYADTAALESAGAAQQYLAQQQLNAAKQQWDVAQAYPKGQLDWLSTQVRGLAPIVPTTQTQSTSSTGQTYSASPLSQIASGLALYKGLTA